MDVTGTIIGITIGVIILVIVIVYLLIRCCICCCRCLFGSTSRGADFGVHAPVPAATTYVVLNQNQPIVRTVQVV